MRRLILLALVMTPGCDRLDKMAMRAAGWETAVVSAQPFLLDSKGQRFALTPPMKARGDVSVCVVLKFGEPMKIQPELGQTFEFALQGTVLSGTATDEAGDVYPLNGPGESWETRGDVSGGPEVSACVSDQDSRIPVGKVISHVQINSDKPLSVLGAYWKSSSHYPPPKG